MYANSPKAYARDCIPVVVLKNDESSLSYTLNEFFDMSLKESCFPNKWKVLSVVLVFKNVGERSTTYNYHNLSLLSAAAGIFKDLVNDRLLDHFKKCGRYSDFQHGFRTSSPTDTVTETGDSLNNWGRTEITLISYYLFHPLRNIGKFIFKLCI